MLACSFLVQDNKIYMHPVVEALTGYSAEELCDLDKWFALLYGEHAVEMRTRYEAYKHTDGTYFSSTTIANCLGAAKEIECTVCRAGSDEWWFVQEKTAKSEYENTIGKLVLAVEAGANYVAIARLNGELLYVNSAMKKLMLDDTAAKQYSLSDFYSPCSCHLLMQEAFPCAVQRGRWRGKTELTDGSGKEIFASQVVTLHTDDNEFFLSLAATDVSEYVAMEQTLRRNEAHLSEVHKMAHLGSYEYNCLTRELRWSGEVYLLFDRPVASTPPPLEEILQQYHPDDLKELLELRHRAFQTGECYEKVIRIRQRNGTWRWCQSVTRPVLAENGTPLRIVGLLMDISDSIKAQQKIEGINDWLEEANLQLVEQQAVLLQMHDQMEKQVLLVNQQAAELEAQRYELEEMNRKLQALATQDALTGIANHRAFQERLALEWQRCQRYGQVFSVVLVDVDKFKTFNDEFGHPEGDNVLKRVAEILQETVREADFVARYGGEEFVLILPETLKTGALEVAERCRHSLKQEHWPLRKVSGSFGVATFQTFMTTAQELIDSADKALYASKKSGRDRVTHIDELDELPF